MRNICFNIWTVLLLLALSSPNAFGVSGKRETGEESSGVNVKRQRTVEGNQTAQEEEGVLLPPQHVIEELSSLEEEESYVPAHALENQGAFVAWIDEEGADLNPDEEGKIFTALFSMNVSEDQMNVWMADENLPRWFRIELAEQSLRNADEKNAFLLQMMREDIDEKNAFLLQMMREDIDASNKFEFNELAPDALKAAHYLPDDYPERNELLQQVLSLPSTRSAHFEEKVYAAMAMSDAYAPKWSFLEKFYKSPLAEKGYKQDIEHAFSKAPVDPLVEQILALPFSSLQRNRLLLGYAKNDTNSLVSRYKALLGLPWHTAGRTELLAFLIINNPVPENLKKNLRSELAAVRGVENEVGTIRMINLALQKLGKR